MRVRWLGVGAAVIALAGCAGDPVQDGAAAPEQPAPVGSTTSATSEPAPTDTTSDEPSATPAPTTGPIGTFAPLDGCPDLTGIGLTSSHVPDVDCGYLADGYTVGLLPTSEPVTHFRSQWQEDADAALIVITEHPEFGTDAFSYVGVAQTLDEYGCTFFVPTTDGATLVFWGEDIRTNPDVTADSLCAGTRAAVEALLVPAA